MAVKFWLYSTASLVACAGLLWYTYMTRMQFYPAVIYLVTSKVSVLVLGNAGLVLTILFARLVKSIFLGQLRDAEVEILHENVRYAITETCLALTIFRDEINFQVVVLFTSLIFLKVFHWLAQSRIEYIEQTDVVTRLTHARLATLMALLAAVDLALVVLCGMKVVEMGPTVFILFGFEFLILLVTLVAILLRYVLYVIDARMDGNWANKFTYLFYLELVSEIFKLIIYLVFFMLIFTYYGMPLHIVRDLWMSVKNLQRRIASYFRYRKITANLNERFPNPTEDELQGTDRTCIICREEMTAATCKKLPCSHIFHIDCLKMWVQRQQTCPTCRSIIPTGVRPPAAPETPARPANANANAAQQQQQPAAAVPGPHVPHAPAVPAPAAPHPHPAVTPHAAAPSVPGAPTPAAAPAQHQPAAPHVHQYAHGIPSPFVPPFIYGAPFGYGFPPGYGAIPPFGFHPPAPGQQHPGAPPLAAPDAATVQRQIEQLQAQLAALQAATQAYSVHIPTAAVPPSQPTVTPQPPVAASAHATSASTPSPATVFAAPAAQAAAPAAAIVTQATSSDDDLEEKAPVPTTAQPASGSDSVQQQQHQQQPVEMEIPRVLTEAERRREELRQRYARIYSSNAATGAAEERKQDE